MWEYYQNLATLLHVMLVYKFSPISYQLLLFENSPMHILDAISSRQKRRGGARNSAHSLLTATMSLLMSLPIVFRAEAYPGV